MKKKFHVVVAVMLTVLMACTGGTMVTPAWGQVHNQAAAAADSGCTAIDGMVNEQVSEQMDALQIPFIENEGQIANEQVKYYAETFVGTVFVTDSGITYDLSAGEKEDKQIIRESFVGGKDSAAVGLTPAVTKVNYFRGSDAAQWQQNVPSFEKIGLGEVYDNIQVNLKAYGSNVEKLFVVAPGGNPEQIKLEVFGAQAVKLNDAGRLALETPAGTLEMTAPVAYQMINGKRIDVPVSYRVEDNMYGFTVGAYDSAYSLVIDPLLASSLFGGAGDDKIEAMAMDQEGNVYITGYTDSSDFPQNIGNSYTEENDWEWSTEWGWAAYPPSPNDKDHTSDVFVSKLSADLKTLLASTFIGGDENDIAEAIMVDNNGNVYIGGRTRSSGIRDYDPYEKYDENKVYDPYSLYYDYDIEEINFEEGAPIAFPTTEGAYRTQFPGTTLETKVIDDYVNSSFVCKLNDTLDTIQASTFIGQGGSSSGGGCDGVNAIALDAAGNIFVAGVTHSNAYPSTPEAYDTSFNGEHTDAFISKLDANLTTLKASTFLGGGDGGGNGTQANDIVVDAAENVYVTGYTTDAAFPIVNGADATFNDDTSKDAFVAKLNNELTDLQASTYLGGKGYDVGWSLALDGSTVYVTGDTQSSDFTVTDGVYQEEICNPDSHLNDVFITRFDADLSNVQASTYIGGQNREDIHDIVVDEDSVYIAGSSQSTDYPTTDGSAAGDDIVISKLNKELTNLLASTAIGGGGLYDGNDTAMEIALRNDAVYIAGTTTSFTYPVTEGAYYKVAGSKGSNDKYAFVSKLNKTLMHARVLDVTTDDCNKSYGVSMEIPIKIKFSANVEVANGTPELQLNAADDAAAVYTGGSGSPVLTFTYTVKAGDAAETLNYTAEDSIKLNGATIHDMGGDDANITLAALDSDQALAAREIKIDTLNPVIEQVTSSKPDGTYDAGVEIPILVKFDEQVTVDGTPKLVLNTEPAQMAVYSEGSRTDTLTFIYTVQAEDYAADLNYAGTDSLQLNGTTIKDAMGMVADVTLPAPDAAESLGANKNIVIDNNAPHITGVSSSLEDGSYGTGQEIPIQVTFSEAVNVTGTPRIALNTDPQHYADYAEGSGTDILTFKYTVKDGDNTLDGSDRIKLNYETTDALILNYGDQFGNITGVEKGNQAILSLPKPDSVNALAGNKAIYVDNQEPGYKSLDVDEETSSTYGAGLQLHINIKFDEPVNVEGTPYLELNTTPAHNAVYESGSGTDTLTFVYTVQEGDEQVKAYLDYCSKDALKLGENGSIKDDVGIDANLELNWISSWVSKYGDLKTKHIKIDTAAPTWDEGIQLETTNITADAVTLSWDAASDNGSIAGYNVYQNDVLLGTTTSYSKSYDVTDLASGTSYAFQVEAVDKAGNESSGGPATIATTTGGVPVEDNEAPVWQESSVLTATAVGVHDLTLNWNKEDATDNVMVTGFKVYQGDTLLGEVDSNTTAYQVTGLKSYMEYTFRVESVDKAGNESINGPAVTQTTAFPDLIVTGPKAIQEQEYLATDLMGLDTDENWPSESDVAPVIWQKYSAVNDYGTLKQYAAEGVRLSYLLEQAGVQPGYGKVIFYSTDASPVALTEELVNQERYYYPVDSVDSIVVEPILAYMYGKGSDGLEPDFNMMTGCNLRLFFGQSVQGEVINNYYLKNIYKIVVGEAGGEEDSTPPSWAEGAEVTTSDITETSVKLSWPAADDNVGVTSYEVYQGTEKVATLAGDVTTYEVTGLAAETEYTFTVKAVDAKGNMSDDLIVTITALAPEPEQAKYTVTPVEDEAYTAGETEDGINTMTVKNGVSGFKYFTVNIAPVKEHSGNETAVFVHVRNGIQIDINATNADFDVVDGAKAGFNVQAEDVVKVFIVDALTNAHDCNPITLQ